MIINLNIKLEQIQANEYDQLPKIEPALITDELFKADKDGNLTIKTSVRDFEFKKVNTADHWILHEYCGQIPSQNLYLIKKTGDGIETVFYAIEHTTGGMKYHLKGIPSFSPNADKIFVPNIELSEFTVHFNLTGVNKVKNSFTIDGYSNNFLKNEMGFIEKHSWINNEELVFSCFTQKGFSPKEFNYFKLSFQA